MIGGEQVDLVVPSRGTAGKTRTDWNKKGCGLRLRRRCGPPMVLDQSGSQDQAT